MEDFTAEEVKPTLMKLLLRLSRFRLPGIVHCPCTAMAQSQTKSAWMNRLLNMMLPQGSMSVPEPIASMSVRHKGVDIRQGKDRKY